MDGRVFTTPSSISLQYWNMLKGLNDTVKMELVALLSNSVVYKKEAAESELSEEEKDRRFFALCGCWADDPEDAAQMEAAIKNGRKNEHMPEINLDD